MAANDTIDPNSASDVVDGLGELAEEKKEVCIGDVLDKFGNRSFAPVMLILALFELTPIGAVPGVPSFLAFCIALIAIQLILGRDHIWVPDWIENRSASSDKISKAVEKLEGVADRIDSVSKERLEYLTRGVALRIAGLVILALCVAVAPLEVLPWGSTVPMMAISVTSLAIMVRDGLAMLVSWVFATSAIGGLLYYYFTSDAAGSGYFPFLS